VQVIEQFEHNILLRPLLQYAGPEERDYVPMSDR
jgi:citrate synthase